MVSLSSAGFLDDLLVFGGSDVVERWEERGRVEDAMLSCQPAPASSLLFDQPDHF